MSTTDLEIENKLHAGNKLIIGDSSEPRLIDELAKKGLNIKGAAKGAGSVLGGIELMLDYKLVVTERSLNIRRELNNYSWNDKKSGTPKDLFNHTIDAAKYSIVYQLTTEEFKRNKPLSFKSIRR
jgi:phage terminase large subunit